MYNTTIEIWELFIIPFLLTTFLAVVWFYPSEKNRLTFGLGLTARLIGGIGFVLIYLFYYQGGDTLAYYRTAVPLVNMIYADPLTGLKLLVEPYSMENYSLFTQETGFPLKYIYEDQSTYMVSRLIVPFLMLTYKSYFLSTILVSAVTFLGPWKLYLLCKELIPQLDKTIQFAVLFFPSVLFWGSGISKDNFTYVSVCYLSYGFYHIVIKRQFSLIQVILSTLSLFLLIVIKPYLFIVLLPGSVLWAFNSTIINIKRNWLRRSIIPVSILLSGVIFIFLFTTLSPYLGDYSAENIITKAVVTQEDLKRSFYGSNSFDIGTIDPSFTGIISKFPIATFYGFYGPTLLHVNNIVMLFSAIENTFLLIMTGLVLVRNNPRKTLNAILDNPFLLYCLSFSIFLAFSIGLTTPNFGALVRFKIPLLPFFSMFLFILYHNISYNPPHKK